MARISLLDHGLAGRTGHHFDLTLNLARRLSAAGHRVSVAGHRSATPDLRAGFEEAGIRFIPLFADSPRAPEVQDPVHGWDARVDRKARELAGLGGADLWLFPTLTADLFAAHVRLDAPPPMAGLLHELPEARGPGAAELWSRACRAGRQRSLRVAIGAIDPDLAARTEGLEVQTFPVPWDGPPRSDHPGRPRRIGFFGHQRRERGLDRLPALVSSLLHGGYEVVLHDSRGRLPPLQHPLLQVRNGFLSDLGAEVRGCDLVVCPMDPRRYRMRLSGVVLQAVACGVPFVLPEGTLSARRFAAGGACQAYPERDPEGPRAAVQAVALDYPRFARAAAGQALTWQEHHGEARFLQAVQAALGMVL